MDCSWNEEEIGEYDTISELMVSDNNYGFIYEKQGSWNIQIKDKTYGPYTMANRLFVYDNNIGFAYQEKGGFYFSLNPKE